MELRWRALPAGSAIKIYLKSSKCLQFFSLPNRKVCLLIEKQNSFSAKDCPEYVVYETVLLQLQAVDYSEYDRTMQTTCVIISSDGNKCRTKYLINRNL